MFCTGLRWVCLVCLLICKEEGFSPVSEIIEKKDMGMCEVNLTMSLLGFGMRTMLVSFHMRGIMLFCSC